MTQFIVVVQASMSMQATTKLRTTMPGHGDQRRSASAKNRQRKEKTAQQHDNSGKWRCFGEAKEKHHLSSEPVFECAEDLCIRDSGPRETEAALARFVLLLPTE